MGLTWIALSIPLVNIFSPARRSIVSRVKECGFLPWSTWLRTRTRKCKVSKGKLVVRLNCARHEREGVRGGGGDCLLDHFNWDAQPCDCLRLRVEHPELLNRPGTANTHIPAHHSQPRLVRISNPNIDWTVAHTFCPSSPPGYPSAAPPAEPSSAVSWTSLAPGQTVSG